MPISNQTAQELKDEAQTIIGHVQNANKMVEKMRAELMDTRIVFDLLKEYQHPKLTIDVKYSGVGGKVDKCTPAQLIDHQVSKINALLGDRA